MTQEQLQEIKDSIGVALTDPNLGAGTRLSLERVMESLSVAVHDASLIRREVQRWRQGGEPEHSLEVIEKIVGR